MRRPPKTCSTSSTTSKANRTPKRRRKPPKSIRRRRRRTSAAASLASLASLAAEPALELRSERCLLVRSLPSLYTFFLLPPRRARGKLRGEGDCKEHRSRSIAAMRSDRCCKYKNGFQPEKAGLLHTSTVQMHENASVQIRSIFLQVSERRRAAFGRWPHSCFLVFAGCRAPSAQACCCMLLRCYCSLRLSSR
jgi:hypothetical protein